MSSSNLLDQMKHQLMLQRRYLMIANASNIIWIWLHFTNAKQQQIYQPHSAAYPRHYMSKPTRTKNIRAIRITRVNEQ